MSGETKCTGEQHRVAYRALLLQLFRSTVEANDSLGKVLFKGFPEGKTEREEEMHK